MRDEHRTHGHEHLATHDHGPAGVDERLVADEGEIADCERRPRIAPAASAHAHVAPEVPVDADERPAALHVEPWAEARQRPDCEHLVALDVAVVTDLDAVLEHDSRGDDDRALAEPHAVPDRRAVAAIGVAALVGGERSEGVRIGAQRLEETLVELPFGLRQLEQRGQAHALERDASRRAPAHRPRPLPPHGRRRSARRPRR